MASSGEATEAGMAPVSGLKKPDESCVERPEMLNSQTNYMPKRKVISVIEPLVIRVWSGSSSC